MLPRLRPCCMVETGKPSAPYWWRETAHRGIVAGIETEFTVQSGTGGEAPDPQAVATRCDLRITAQRLLKRELRPDVDRAGGGIATMVQVDCGELILLCQDVGNAVAVAGLHGGERGGVIWSRCLGLSC